DYGSFLKDILQPVNVQSFNWHIDNIETYTTSNDRPNGELFPQNGTILKGLELKEVIETEQVYVIFAELRAFQGAVTSPPQTYEEFTA
ncbi:DUF2691 family protein, partial [Peribacillus sp. SIMBA_075]|uniref:DUF2691 family protein n=1 Tax=Peribacillus sp. SIMBA_075 TaxID=3085813 RepID=UPI00397D52DF